MNVLGAWQGIDRLREWWPWVASAAGVALLLIYPFMVLRKYVRIMINILDDVAPMPENGGNDHVKLIGEELSFRAVDGHRLHGVLLSGRTGQASKGMVVFAHEFGSVCASCLRYCRPLLKAGYDVFAFDFRGHGASAPEEGYRPRHWPSDRERADMLGAIAFIGSYLEQQGRPRDVALFGISRGAGAAILAAVGIDSIRAIVTDGAFSSDTTIEYLMKRFATIFARLRIVAEYHPASVWRLLRWLLFRECKRKFNCRFPSVRKAIVKLGSKPILLIHGEKDSYIPIAQSQALFQLAAGPKELWIVPGASHNQSVMVQPEAYARRLVAFFDEHLDGYAAQQRAATEFLPKRAPDALPAPAAVPAYAYSHVAGEPASAMGTGA
ncbi:MAG: alpha/beta fold hydrolase [Planctomycetes bacterium]|nr:alpha/beta fold hydrolase [Planctomycetota bacterium]